MSFTTFSTFSSNQFNSPINKLVFAVVSAAPGTIFIPTSSQFTSNTLSIAGQTNPKQNGTYNILSSTQQYPQQYPDYGSFNGITGGTVWVSNNNYVVSGASSGAYNGTSSTTTGAKSYTGEWIQIQLPSAIKLVSYGLLGRLAGYGGSSSPKIWYILGSNNGSTWDLIDSQSVTTTFWSPTATMTTNFTITSTTPITFPVSPASSYSYYRIVVNSIVNGVQNFASINQFNLTGN